MKWRAIAPRSVRAFCCALLAAAVLCACLSVTKAPEGSVPTSRGDGRRGTLVVEYPSEFSRPAEREAVAKAFLEAGYEICDDAKLKVRIGLRESTGGFYQVWGALAAYAAFIYPYYAPLDVALTATVGEMTVEVTSKTKVFAWLPLIGFLDSSEKTWCSLLHDSTVRLIGKMEEEGILPPR